MLFKDKTAIGVEFLRNGTMQKVFADKEVVLSAGAIGSPKILLMSGIGPTKHLSEMKVISVGFKCGIHVWFH